MSPVKRKAENIRSPSDSNLATKSWREHFLMWARVSTKSASRHKLSQMACVRGGGFGGVDVLPANGVSVAYATAKGG